MRWRAETRIESANGAAEIARNYEEQAAALPDGDTKRIVSGLARIARLNAAHDRVVAGLYEVLAEGGEVK